MQDLYYSRPFRTPRLSLTPSHRRDSSDELDVFEASRYMSGCTDADPFHERRRWEEQNPPRSPRPQPPPAIVPDNSTNKRKNNVTTEKKPVSPSSGRFTRFLASLFHPNSKRESKGKPVKSDDEEDVSAITGSSRRRRRRGRRSSRASVSSEPARLSRAHPLGDLERAGSGSSSSDTQVVPLWERSRRVHHARELAGGELVERKWTLNGGCGGMVVVEDVVAKGRRGHLWRREEVEYGGGGESDSSEDLFELPVFESTAARTSSTVKL